MKLHGCKLELFLESSDREWDYGTSARDGALVWDEEFNIEAGIF